MPWADVQMRFDILWSRVPLLDTELMLPIDIGGTTVGTVRGRAEEVLSRIDDWLQPLPDAWGRMDLLAEVDAELEPLETDLQTLLVGFQVERHRLYEKTRSGIMSLGRQHSMTVGGFFIVTLMLLTMSLLEARIARKAERRFRHFATSASDILWETDAALVMSFVSEGGRCGRQSGGDGSGTGARFCFPRWDALTSAETQTREWAQHLRDLSLQRPFRDFRRRVRTADGDVLTWHVSAVPVFDRAGRFRGYRGVATDITAKLEQEERIRFLAEHDPMTGLVNRAAFQSRLWAMVDCARERRGSCVLLVADLDGFKEINDHHGHDTGDAVLCIVGARLREAAPAGAVAARVGGDEFALAFPIDGRDGAEVDALARVIMACVGRPAFVNGRELSISGCGGVSIYPRDGQAIDKLLKAADLALYCAKRDGPGSLRLFDRTLLEEAERRWQIERALRLAVATSRIEVHYQPIVRLADRRVLALEALARWTDPQLGPISPAIFIPIAEESSLINQIGKAVLMQACCDAAAWDGALAGACVSVNLSPAQFRSEIATVVEQALVISGLDPSRLILEITETVLMQDSGTTLQTLNQLSEKGVGLAIDDFGAGYTSLAYLKKFPVHKIKLDRSFVSDLEDSEDSRLIVEAMIRLAHVLGLQTVAEGVETEAQLAFLERLGCDEVQGYLLGRPGPLDRILAARLRAAANDLARSPVAPPVREVGLAQT
ncbi:putative bifunctional diguanylate cyclase/phosphodiesterase [Lutibaculum baratangense]|uniref:putative bifunctional diguanylate cyclase/phosphodiesterase n=1 Tax=Lutibaculum baratangense TaxID=1358440 RepID=UPI0013622739|nr:bifunctional diguanylate cyclase/phosphodiesterase [Lutibaculum baratangense]